MRSLDRSATFARAQKLWSAVLVIAAALSALSGPRVQAADATGGKKSNHDPQPLTLVLKAVLSTYHLRDGAAVKNDLEAARRSNAAEMAADGATTGTPPPHVGYPEPPTVDLQLTITNHSKGTVQLMDRSDDRATLTLVLEGPGAVSARPQRLRTMDMRESPPLILAPGKSHSFRFNRLASGFRGDSDVAYWTSPGDYRVTVRWKTPIARGAGIMRGDDWSEATLTSNAVTVKVKTP